MFLNNQVRIINLLTPLPAGACFRLHFVYAPNHQHHNTTAAAAVIIVVFSNQTRTRSLVGRPERSRALL